MPGGPAGGAHRSKTARRASGLGKYKPQYRAPRNPIYNQRAAHQQRRQPAEWSNLILQSISQVVDPLGNIMHKVRPMEDPRDRAPGERTSEWYAERGRGDPDIVGKFSPLAMKGVLETPAEAAEANKVQKREVTRGPREEMLSNPAPMKARPVAVTAEDVGKMTQEMSWEAFNKLSPRQKTAVEFNSMLADAVQRDLASQDSYDPTKEERSAYDKRVGKLFGKDRGSDIYAPETMAVLKKLNLRDTVDDLDDYLGLKVAITTDDLSVLEKPQPNKISSDLFVQDQGESRIDFINKIASNTKIMQDEMAKSNSLLQTISATVKRDVADDVELFGGTPEVNIFPGFGRPAAEGADPKTLDDKFSAYYELIARADTEEKTGMTAEQILGFASTDLKPGEMRELLGYFDTRSRNAKEYGTPLGNAEKPDLYKTPDEFRKILGLDR